MKGDVDRDYLLPLVSSFAFLSHEATLLATLHDSIQLVHPPLHPVCLRGGAKLTIFHSGKDNGVDLAPLVFVLDAVTDQNLQRDLVATDFQTAIHSLLPSTREIAEGEE